jgi:adenine C2-methylase RlmN of 23S rRNA A2503 and tRNA A37
MEKIRQKNFTNGSVYALKTNDGYLVETTDTFLPECTKHCNYNIEGYGDRTERWMIGISVMSGCPVGCKFCATGNMNNFRNLTEDEIISQMLFVLDCNPQYKFSEAKEHKVNYTRMGEPFLNIKSVRKSIELINSYYPDVHHYVSTIGIKDSDFSWIKENITLQISLHSLDEERRNHLIPFSNKMTIKELGQIRTKSNLKTTVNLTLVDYADFNIENLKEYFDPQYFFIKLSPINPNLNNTMGRGVINGRNY